MTGQSSVVDQLVALGFSQYEARTYVGLAGQPAMTGYALSNATQVPQPKVYETLRRLEEKRAVVKISDQPARYVAIDPDQLLEQLEARFRTQLADARAGLSEIADGGAEDVHVFEGARSWPAIARLASEAVSAAERHVYVSGHAQQLGQLQKELEAADARGVQLDVLCFGRTRMKLKNGRLLTHSSTDGVIYRHHQARHLALVADNSTSLWALAPSGQDWNSMTGHDPMLTSVIKGYIRHDTYVQQIYEDFRESLDERYGPGLKALVTSIGGLGLPAAGELEPVARRRSA
jgi:HTH-type transcriptional regulator, sugar sensing transcriptional regulator